MHDIEIFWKSREPVEAIPHAIRVEGPEFSSYLSHHERKRIDGFWEAEMKRTGRPNTSKPRQYGTLLRANDSEAVYGTAAFHEYLFVSRHPPLYLGALCGKEKYMRISSVGGVVWSRDGYTVVHRRPKSASHVPGVYDASVAGLCPNEDDSLDFERALREKLQREMRVDGEVEEIRVTGLHSSGVQDFSGMFTYEVQTGLGIAALGEKVRSAWGDNFVVLRKGGIGDFVVDNYGTGPACLDGAVTLASTLPHDEFLEVMDGLRERGRTVAFGRLDDGVLVKDESVRAGT